ncbi:MAG: transketolase [Alphaproteobacteria bacterium]|nr:transketolase [Alphaproteobacteria bacterium]MBU1514942.1 transketolase [Alphaproteobacteria bacterium]MBU2095621.1 transketolase [Alphaproteobacteria bacterium]MBU2153919.1 transketolase [Alphaproteobacteria bacterium]MBU2309082.1 transketolase [Alphaproteobacteria bacterium]
MPQTQPVAPAGHNRGAEHDLEMLRRIDDRLRWLATWTIHNANHLRESRDGLKVGGHQASCASMTTIMTALYFHALKPEDRVAVKPHASPVFHAAQYLMGRQTREQMEAFRSFGGAQSYPSRTKDKDDVDFSTGSVGLGVAITAFASLMQDYLSGHGWLAPERRGRFVATMGDAELDEGNIYECLIEAYKHDIRNVWWIVDYNRQSLDATTADRMFDRFDDIFETAGWRVITLKWGKAQMRAFARPGGKALQAWIEACPNADFAALTYQQGAAWRARLMADIGKQAGVRALLDSYADDELHSLMINLGGHCIETLTEAFDAAQDDTPTMFIAYTVKGFGLPLQGHKDNHAGLMTPTQVEALRQTMGVAEGQEWEPMAGLTSEQADAVTAFVAAAPFAQPATRQFKAPPVPVPNRADFPSPDGAEQSTQQAFGRILLDLAKSGHPLADRIVTTSPDVTVSTNLGGFVNQRGLFRRSETADVFRDAKIPSPQRWAGKTAGQHVELGIAEHNLFLNLAAFGLSAPLFGERLLPIGTVYDPFISRGLDALNYACYQDARFMLVATPSGLTLGPEGGAHQSIYTPLIGIGQPGLTYFEPAFVDELAEVMRWSFGHMQADDGGSVYLRLTTRQLTQVERADDAWREDALKGAYWLKAPGPAGDAAIVFCGAIAPEVLQAAEQLADDIPGLGVLNVVSPGLLHRDWMASRRSRWQGGGKQVSHAEALLGQLAPGAGLVTVIDASPATLSWLGGVLGQRVSSLGLDSFGQVGDLPDLYAHYRLDVDAIVDAAADLFL